MFDFSFPTLSARGACATLAVATFASFAVLAYAQHDHAMSAATASTALTASTASSTAPLSFDSVLSRYKPMTEQKLGSWKDANDTVTRIGGWRTYLKESETPAAAPPGAPALATPTLPPAPTVTPATPPKANPHAGHEAKP